MNPEYQTRDKTDYKLIKNFNNQNTLSKILKQEYPYIIQSMKHEKYKIEYEKYEILQELLYENKVIGIISIELINQIIQTLCINEVYILPEYRHKGIFYEALLNLLTQPNITIALKNPNRTMINLLLQYDFAKKLENNLVLSYIDFYVEDNKIYTNKQIKTEYDTNYIKNENITTDFYDLNINSCVFLQINHLKENNSNKAFIIKARLTDSKQEKYYTLLKNVDNIYLDNLKERLINITEDDIIFLENVRKRVDEYLDINEILGTKEELSPIFKDKLKEYNLTEKDGQMIRRKVSKALKNKEIIPKSIVIRTLYLLENYDKDEYNINNYYPSNPLEECTYCSNELKGNEEVCVNCGYNLLGKEKTADRLLELLTDKIIYDKLPSNLTLKEKRNNKQEKIANNLKEELNYMDYDEEEVYNIQSIISTYQFLKNIDDIIYFEIYNYDQLNNIQDGSTFQYALNNKLIKQLKNYQFYIILMENYYPEKFLKKILEDNNYSLDGQKDELINRIEKNINPRDIFGDKYVLTKKGNEFIVGKDYLENYLENLSEFTFYEYQKFYDKNKKKSFKELNQDFIKYMKQIALETSNYYKYHDIIRHILNKANICQEDFLIYFTLLFIIDINYWIESKEHRKMNKPLSINVVHEYPEIKSIFHQNNLDEIFRKAMNRIELNDLKNNGELVKFYLKKSLEYTDIDDINREIEYNIFKDEYLSRYTV